MEEKKNLLNETKIGSYDASSRPFDFVETYTETALVCEPDEITREKISAALRNLEYHVTKVSSVSEALKSMRFHVYNIIVLNEIIDPSEPVNNVLAYLDKLPMTTRRKIFVALLNNTCRTMDNMAAFNKSVNVTINMKNIDELGFILKKAVADNSAFYSVFRASLKKTGRI